MEQLDFFGLNRKQSTADTVYPGTWIPVGGNSTDGVNERNLLINNKEWVYIAIDKVASAAASVNIQVKKASTRQDDQEIFQGPLYDFLEMPGVVDDLPLTGKDFIYLNTVYKELTGNAFWERQTAGKLSPLIPTAITPKLDNNNRFIGYTYNYGGKERFIKHDAVLHDKYIDPARPYWGAGKLQKIARWVDTSSFANEFLRRFFVNGATFGGFITTEEETEARIKMIKAGLANDHVGVENAHKIGVLPKGSDYKQTTSNMSDMEMGATDDRYRDKILSGFGVPKTLVGLTTEVNRASAEASEYIFARYTIKPIIEDLVEFLNVVVAPIYDPTGQYYFDYEEFVPVNMEIELKEREIALNRQPYKTVNEVRAEQGLPPVQGGDVVYGPPFQTPLGEPQAAPEPLPGPNEDEDEETPEPPQKSRSWALPGRVRRSLAREDALDSLATKLAKFIENQESKNEDPDEIAWRSFVGRVDSYTEQTADKVRQFNTRQKLQLLNRLNNLPGINPGEKDVNKKDLFDFSAEVAVMVDFVGPILRGLLTEQALAEYQEQGYEGSFDNGADSIGRTIERAGKRLAKSYNTTTLKLLKRTLNEGITQGDSLDQLTKRVNEVYDYSDQVRARAVAHTETFYIANEGNKEAYRQSGVVKSIRWYTAEDERVCPWCLPQNGKIVGINENFYKKGDTVVGSDGQVLTLNYRSIDVPPLHTNCRCFVRAERIEIGE